MDGWMERRSNEGVARGARGAKKSAGFWIVDGVEPADVVP